jgi:hypothetical protein
METVEQKIARVASWRYQRAWGGEREDYEQEAHMALLLARRTYDPGRGVPWAAYAARAVYRALHGYAIKQRSPVGGTRERLLELLSLGRVELDDWAARVVTAAQVARSAVMVAQATPETESAEQEWTERVRERIEVALDQDQRGDGYLARAMLLRGWQAAEAGARYGCSRWRVFKASARVEAALREDPQVLQLAQEAGLCSSHRKS